jgi:hypothetical protein
LLRLGDVSFGRHDGATNGMHNTWFVFTHERDDEMRGDFYHPSSLGTG